jgi:hypothetical protein
MNALSLIGVLTAAALVALVCYSLASGAAVDVISRLF